MFHSLTKSQFPFEGTPPNLAKKPPMISVDAIVEDDPSPGKQEELSPDGKLRKVAFRHLGAVRRCWLPVELLKPAEETERPPVILWAFLTTCVRAEEWINKKPDTGEFYANADYLIALAIYESKIANLGKATPDTDAIGPFQLTSARWKEFLAGVNDPDFSEDDRDNVADQIYGAAFLSREDAKSISKEITAHDAAAGTNTTAQQTGAYIPTYTDLFIAAVVSPKAAIELRKLEVTGQGDKLITEIVSALPPDRKAEMERIFRHNHHIMKVDSAEAEAKGIAAGPRTVSDLYQTVESKLDELLSEAFKLIQDNVPELLPVTSNEAKWLETAIKEQAEPWKNGELKENSPAGTARVLEYFKATDLKTDVVLAWCGAFAAFCMKQAGGEFANSIVKGSARAANWKGWGNLSLPIASKDVPTGAVVVLSPTSQRSGHVGFYSPNQSGAAGKVTLLGGNQGDSVKDSDHPRSEIVAIRWLGQPLGSASPQMNDQIPPGNGIAWGRFVDAKFGNSQFKQKVIDICTRINCDPNFLMAAMAFETGRSFSAKQKNTAGGSATGLIQFMPTTAAGLGTSISELAGMTEIRQLDFVEKYLVNVANGRPFKRLSDVYMAILWPKAFGNAPETVIFRHPEKAYRSNKGLDINGDKTVTVAEATAKVTEQLQRGLRPENRG